MQTCINSSEQNNDPARTMHLLQFRNSFKQAIYKVRGLEFQNNDIDRNILNLKMNPLTPEIYAFLS